MKKVVGYVVSVVGLLFMALGFGDFSSKVPILNGLSSGVINVIGLVFVIVGVALAMKEGTSKKAKQDKSEVPIYEGVGKKRRIVGYRREK